MHKTSGKRTNKNFSGALWQSYGISFPPQKYTTHSIWKQKKEFMFWKDSIFFFQIWLSACYRLASTSKLHVFSFPLYFVTTMHMPTSWLNAIAVHKCTLHLNYTKLSWQQIFNAFDFKKTRPQWQFELNFANFCHSWGGHNLLGLQVFWSFKLRSLLLQGIFMHVLIIGSILHHSFQSFKAFEAYHQLVKLTVSMNLIIWDKLQPTLHVLIWHWYANTY